MSLPDKPLVFIRGNEPVKIGEAEFVQVTFDKTKRCQFCVASTGDALCKALSRVIPYNCGPYGSRSIVWLEKMRAETIHTTQILKGTKA